MKAVSRIALHILAMVVAVAVAVFILRRNLEAGVYPDHADSIGLPIMDNIMFALLALAVLLPAAILPHLPSLRQLAAEHAGWRVVLFLFVFVFLLFGVFLCASWSLNWLRPDEYPIMAAWLFAALLIAIFGIIDLIGVLRRRAV